MNKLPETALYFNEVTAIEPDIAYFTGHLFIYDDTDEEFTRLVRVQGDSWGHLGDIDCIVWSVCAYLEKEDQRAVASLCRNGALTLFSGRSRSEEIIDITPGYLFQISKIGSALYTCGSKHQVFRRSGAQWFHHDEGMFKEQVVTGKPAFFGIDGTSEKDIYCVGRYGVIAYYDGNHWAIMESPTNSHLERVLCVSPNEVYICGKNGSLFKGSKNFWTFIGNEDYQEHFWGITRFQNKIYVCSDSHIWVYDGNDLKQIDTGLTGKVSFYRIASAGSTLWATSGREDIYRFDGSSWSRILCPDNRF